MFYESSNVIIKNNNGSKTELKKQAVEQYYNSMVKVLNRRITKHILCERQKDTLTINVRTLIGNFYNDVINFYLKEATLYGTVVPFRSSLHDALELIENELKKSDYEVKFEYSGDGSMESFINDGKFKINF